MRIRLFFVGASVAGLVAAVGCGGSSSSGSEIAIDDVGSLYADAQCKAVTDCFGNVLELFQPGEDCAQGFETAFDDQLGALKAAIDDGRVTFHGDRVQACLDAVSSSGCDGLLRGEPQACKDALQGTVASGSSCTLNEECSGDAYCKTGNVCPGACAPLETANGECKSDDDCSVGLICSESTDRCTAPAGPGNACGGASDPDCQPGYFCVGDDEETGASGTCRTIDETFSADAGAACSPTEGPFCKAGLGCAIEAFDPNDGSFTATCKMKVASGADCEISFPDICPLGEFCKAVDSLVGTCTTAPVAGQACETGPFDDPGTGDICAPNTRCENGMCRGFQRLGGSCVTDDVCFSNNCKDLTCSSGTGC